MDKQDKAELKSLIDSGAIEITPISNHIDVSDSSRFSRVTTNPKLAGVLSQFPALVTVASTTGLYSVRFPKGISGELVKLSTGGYSSMISGSNGKFAAHASFYNFELSPVLGVMTAMAIASGQYFLTHINREMTLISQSIDQILDFLYGDKKAELLSEIIFIQRATRDYTSIMSHDEQRIATLNSIYGAEKVAMKDIEFYMADLEKTSKSKIEENTHIKNATETILQICESLHASLQLYISSCILEVYYAQNTDSDFIDALKSDLDMYIEKCRTRMLKFVSHLKGRIDNARPVGVIKKSSLKKQPYSDQLSNLTDKLSNGITQALQQSVSEALDSSKRSVEFIASSTGDLYLKRHDISPLAS